MGNLIAYAYLKNIYKYDSFQIQEQSEKEKLAYKLATKTKNNNAILKFNKT